MTERSRALPQAQYRDPCEWLEQTEESTRFQDRLENWIRWARIRPWQSATCWSAEGRYLIPRDETAAQSEEDTEEAKERERQRLLLPSAPDAIRKLIADAQLFEDVWRNMPDSKHKLMLALVYHRHARWSVSRVCVALHLPRHQYGDMLRAARAMLRNRVRSMGG